MDDLTKLLDGSADDVKAGIAGKGHDDLLKLRTAEEAGKKRKGVLADLVAAIDAADVEHAGDKVQGEAAPVGAATSATAAPLVGIAAALDASGPANIPPATDIDTSGAPQQIVPGVDMTHPAVDANPRAGTTVDQNRIDFNDPIRPGVDVVTDALKSA